MASNNSQIPNAFSTQVPFNMMVLWNGIANNNVYFADNSWLKTVLIHELSHNYQINGKKSNVSRILNKIFGKNYNILFMIYPNIFLPTAILEGNAVLNESIYGNGGRLYNGTLNALKNTLIFNNKINPTTFINNHISFPYREEKYIVGAFYMKYLSEKYGMDKVNKLFYEHSTHYINPLLISSTFKKNFNVDFEKTITDFVKYTKKKHKNFKEEKIVDKIAESKSRIFFSKIDNRISFITTNLLNLRNIYTYSIKTNKYKKDKTNLINGKIFRINKKLYTASSYYTSPNSYKYGLFDKNRFIVKSSSGQHINDIYKNRKAYIDINKASIKRKLYINKKFYREVSSNAIFDKDGNIYYFMQKDNIRTLYKNMKKIFSLKGYYSYICEIVENEIFFIANTKNGSSLYKISNNKLYKLSESDNIVNAKMINKNYAMVVTITSNGYVAHKIKLKSRKIKKTFYENIENVNNKFIFDEKFDEVKLKSKDYNEITNLEFISINPKFSYSSDSKLDTNIKFKFIDALKYNQFDIVLKNFNNKSYVDINYLNRKYIPFKISLYNDSNVDTLDIKKYKFDLLIYDLLLKKGDHSLRGGIKYYSDSNNDLSTLSNLTYDYSKYFKLGEFPYLNNSINFLYKNNKKIDIFKIDFQMNQHIINEFYIDTYASFIYDNAKIPKPIILRKQELSNNKEHREQINTYIPSLNYSLSANKINKFSIGFSKTLNFSKYFYTVPVSLIRESIFYKFNKYKVYSNRYFESNEQVFGMRFNMLYFHIISFPLTLKYSIISNNYQKKKNSKFTFNFGITF